MFKAEELRVAMARQNLNIGDVAERSGINRSTVSLVVNDRADNLQIDTLEKIAAAVGLKAEVAFVPITEPAEVPA